MPTPSNDPKPESGHAAHPAVPDLLKQIASGAREAGRPEDYGALSAKLRELADMLKPSPVYSSFTLRGDLDPARDALFTLRATALQDPRIESVAFDPRGAKIAMIDGTNTLKVFSTTQREDTGSPLELFSVKMRGSNRCDSLAFGPEGDRILVRSLEGERHLKLVSITQKTWLRGPVVLADIGGGFDIKDFSYAKDGGAVALACSDAAVRLVDPRSGKSIAEYQTYDAVTHISLSADGSQILAVDRGKGDVSRVYLLDVVKGEKETRLEPVGRVDLGRAVTAMSATPDLSRAALALKGNGIAIYDSPGRPQEMAPIQEIPLAADVFSMEFSPDGKGLAACAQDNKLRVFDLVSGEGAQPVQSAAFQASVWLSDLRFSPDGTKLAVVEYSGKAHVFGAKLG